MADVVEGRYYNSGILYYQVTGEPYRTNEDPRNEDRVAVEVFDEEETEVSTTFYVSSVQEDRQSCALEVALLGYRI